MVDLGKRAEIFAGWGGFGAAEGSGAGEGVWGGGAAPLPQLSGRYGCRENARRGKLEFGRRTKNLAGWGFYRCQRPWGLGRGFGGGGAAPLPQLSGREGSRDNVKQNPY